MLTIPVPVSQLSTHRDGKALTLDEVESELKSWADNKNITYVASEIKLSRSGQRLFVETSSSSFLAYCARIFRQNSQEASEFALHIARSADLVACVAMSLTMNFDEWSDECSQAENESRNILISHLYSLARPRLLSLLDSLNSKRLQLAERLLEVVYAGKTFQPLKQFLRSRLLTKSEDDLISQEAFIIIKGLVGPNESVDDVCNPLNEPALQIAARLNNLDVIQALVEKGANVNLVHNKRVALHGVIQNINVNAFEYLCMHGARLNIYTLDVSLLQLVQDSGSKALLDVYRSIQHQKNEKVLAESPGSISSSPDDSNFYHGASFLPPAMRVVGGFNY